MKKIVFLDLEGTVIESVDTPHLIRTSQVRDFLQRERPEDIGIFSAALYTEKEVGQLHRHILPSLECALGVTFDRFLIPHMGEVCRAIERQHRLGLDSVSLTDFFEFFGKEGGFLHYARRHPDLAGCECVLLDDAVEDVEIRLKDRTLRLVNVTSM